LVSRILVAGLDPESGLEQEDEGQSMRRDSLGASRSSLGSKNRDGSLALAALEMGLEAAANPLERSYRPKMLQVLPKLDQKGETEGEGNKEEETKEEDREEW